MAGVVIGAGALIGSTIVKSKQASKAAKTQEKAFNQGVALKKQQYETTRADYAPYRDAGLNALGTITDPARMAANFQTDPGYQFAFNEGQRAVQSSAAAKGSLHSGAAFKALARYGTGVAQQAYGDYYDRVARLANLGYDATGAVNAAGQNYANAASAGGSAAANARASGYLNQGELWGGAIDALNPFAQSAGSALWG